jgi:hypothetical protein
MRSVLHLKSLALVVALLSAVTVAGCGDDDPPPTTPVPDTTASITWATSLATDGASSRSFTTTRTGTVSITLQSLSAPAESKVGVGVGIPLGDGSGCVLSRSVEASAGSTAQLELDVDAGSYCVQVYDRGDLTQPTSFTILLVYPIVATS